MLMLIYECMPLCSAVSRRRKLLGACNLIDVIQGNVITTMNTYSLLLHLSVPKQIFCSLYVYIYTYTLICSTLCISVWFFVHVQMYTNNIYRHIFRHWVNYNVYSNWNSTRCFTDLKGVHPVIAVAHAIWHLHYQIVVMLHLNMWFLHRSKVAFAWRQHDNTVYREQSKYIAKSEVGYARKQRNLFVLFTQSLFPAA